MRLKHIFISEYKNIRDFTLDFESDNFIEVFVGKNGSGKSNFLEALIEIFRHVFSFDKDRFELKFNYIIKYEIKAKEVEIEWIDDELRINQRTRKTVGKTLIPENLLVYYSGHNISVNNQLALYEQNFRSRIRRASIDESRKIIGIGPEYKELLLAILLIQEDGCRARKYITTKLGIQALGMAKPGSNELTEPVLKLVLDRPTYAKGNESAGFDIVNNNREDRFWRPKGITNSFLEQLHTCMQSSPGGLTVENGYFQKEDRYILYFSIKDIQTVFAKSSPQELFRQFDNLKTLGMLTEMSVPASLINANDASVTHFSDGQFQSIYIYAITELFKDSDCITLLDEPDAFLHPEWQFEFLNQVEDISEDASGSNHILMTSHSASTIAATTQVRLREFEISNQTVTPTKKDKSEIISSLSAGLISFSKEELLLNIDQILKDAECPILFTEGPTDVSILERGWDSLFPDKTRPFAIESGYGRQFLRSLFKDEIFISTHSNRILFALFDFDDAYSDWNQLGDLIQNNPDQCLVRRRPETNHFALLLPVPATSEVRRQVIRDEVTKDTFEQNSRMTIEHLFFHCSEIRPLFRKIVTRPGDLLEFPSGQKTSFASQTIGQLTAEQFGNLSPLFDQIQNQISAAET